MNEGKTILLYERYLSNSQDEIDLYDQLGLELPETFGYREIALPIDEVEDIKKVDEKNCRIYFYNGYNVVVYGDADSLFIEINDIKNNEIESTDEGI